MKFLLSLMPMLVHAQRPLDRELIAAARGRTAVVKLTLNHTEIVRLLVAHGASTRRRNYTRMIEILQR